jgi:hypothetical protein
MAGRALAAADSDDPFQRWLGLTGVTYVASGTSDSSQPAPAATLVVQLPADQKGVLYLPRRVTAFPATERMAVPAGQELWLFVLAKSAPVALVVIPPIPAGSERVVEARDIQASPAAVVGWVHLLDADRNALKTARGVSLPRIRITGMTKDFDAGTLPAPEDLGGALVLFSGVPPGAAELQISGRGWLPYRSKVTAGPQHVTLLQSPIQARVSATLVVSWSTLGDLSALERSFESCETAPPPRLELVVSSCPTPVSGQPFDPSKCQLIRKEPQVMEMTYGSVTIGEVPPGLYQAELHYGKLPPVGATTTLAPLDLRPLRLFAAYTEVYGSLTHGDKPLEKAARIEFPGNGAGFAAGDGSDYHGVLPGRDTTIASDAKVDIVTCRGARTFILTDRPIVPHMRFDIDIPDNVLTISVIDTFTRQPIPSANVKYVVMSLAFPRVPKVTRVFPLSAGTAGAREADADNPESAAGRLVLRAVPHREIRLEVNGPGYKKQVIDPFTMDRTETKDLEVQLIPLSGDEGRILSSHPFEKAMIYWHSPTGAATEVADLAFDGKFYVERQHFSEETMTIVSTSHPLWVAHAPLPERRKPLEIRFPDGAPVREAEVWIPLLPARLVTPIGVTIGGLRVPGEALAQHLALRGEKPLIRGPGPLYVRALAATGAIEILRGPSLPADMAARVPRDFAPTAKQPLPPTSNVVAFGGKS